jgi:hypothetical protein
MRKLVLAAVVAACGGGHGSGADAVTGGDSAGGDAGSSTLSDDHPGDVGLGSDPAVVWFEDFEEGSVAAITGRYDQAQGTARMHLVSDHAGGAAALSLVAGGGVDAVDLYKQLADHDELFVRWYAKYQADAPWHHSGMWVGGYNPAQPYPNPQAGLRPNGDDRFSIAIEPVWNVGATGTRFDFYNYWMGMQSWMATPTNDGTSYYGNSLVHANAFTLDEGTWVCLELHIRVNPDAGSGAGAVLEVWKNDAPVISYRDAGPPGYWIRDKFCPSGADGTECTDYPAPATDHLDLRLRSTTAYGLNAFWPQNYITDAAQGELVLDQMVVATRRIGCLRP